MRFIQDWAGLLFILTFGVLVGLVTWLATTPQLACQPGNPAAPDPGMSRPA